MYVTFIHPGMVTENRFSFSNANLAIKQKLNSSNSTEKETNRVKGSLFDHHTHVCTTAALNTCTRRPLVVLKCMPLCSGWETCPFCRSPIFFKIIQKEINNNPSKNVLIYYIIGFSRVFVRIVPLAYPSLSPPRQSLKDSSYNPWQIWSVH